MFILFRPPSGLRGWLSSVFTQWSESSLRMILPDPFASADLSTVPWGSPNLPSSLCWDRKLEQAATKVLLGEAGIGLERNQIPPAQQMLGSSGCCEVQTALLKPQSLPAATLVRHWQDKRMENCLGSRAARVSFCQWCKRQLGTGVTQARMPVLFNALILNLDNGMKHTPWQLHFPAGLGAFFRIDLESLIIKNT